MRVRENVCVCASGIFGFPIARVPAMRKRHRLSPSRRKRSTIAQLFSHSVAHRAYPEVVFTSLALQVGHSLNNIRLNVIDQEHHRVPVVRLKDNDLEGQREQGPRGGRNIAQEDKATRYFCSVYCAEYSGPVCNK